MVKAHNFNAGPCVLPKKAIESAIEAIKKLAEITKIIDVADFNNMVSENETGEDYGLRESMCAISLILDGKYRWW